MTIYIVNELTRLMENSCDIYATLHGAYRNKQDALNKLEEVKEQIKNDLDGGEVITDELDIFEMTRGSDVIEVRMEEEKLQ